MKRVLKFATGDEVPSDAVYLTTIAQTHELGEGKRGDCWYVWHYFLVQR
jgi:hypothetical protein